MCMHPRLSHVHVHDMHMSCACACVYAAVRPISHEPCRAPIPPPPPSAVPSALQAAHLLHHELFCGWAQWAAQHLHGRTLFLCTQQLVLSLVTHYMIKAWSRLALCRDAARAARAKGGLSRLKNGKLSAGWNLWVEMVAEWHQAIERMRRSLSSMVNCKLAMGFQGWLGATVLASDAQRQRDSMSKSLLHVLHHELSRGWVCWHEQWQEVVRKRESVRRGLRHMTNGKLSAGWNSWTEMLAERRESQELMRRSLTGHATLLERLRRWRSEAASGELAGLLGLQRALALQGTATIHYATVLGRRALRVWASHWGHTLRGERIILQRRRDRLLRGFGWLQARRVRVLCLRRSCGHWLHRAHVEGWNAIVTTGISAVKLELRTSRAIQHAVVVALVRRRVESGLLVAP